MTDKEKLNELMVYAKDLSSIEREVDFLLANGVTFATDTNDGCKWISVEDRLPECKQDVLMYFDTGNMAAGFWHDGDETITFWCAYTDDGWFTDCDCEPLYWMPLPEPPKEA